MRGKRVRFIRDLIEKKDPNMLLSIRSVYGNKTMLFTKQQAFKAAKKLWRTKGLKENWGWFK